MICMSCFVQCNSHEISFSSHSRPRPALRVILLVSGVLAMVLLGMPPAAEAQALPNILAPQPLITQALNEQQRTVLHGNIHPLTRTALDHGAAPADMPMRRMTLVLKRSAQQEAALRELLDEQQTRGTPNYHQWLTPDQFGQQFGPSDSDLAAVKSWLQSHGFTVSTVTRGRIAIEFSGTAGQVGAAFHTSIHKYGLNGEQHWANSSDPSIPAALAPVVKGVLTLHNFPRHPQFTLHASPVHPPQSSTASSPLFTFTASNNTYYGLGPTDFATIYNVLPLWNAGIDGTGQTIAIVGETNIHVTDIEDFRSLFNLPAKDPKVILNGEDPGIVGDEPEAVLDVSWSGAVAKNATIDLVVSASTETSLGVDLSALYIVDSNLAPVMSESYGECEATLGNAGNAFYNALWQQAAAQGITVVLAAGDAGSAGCDNFDTQAFAYDGLAVSGFASTPYNVAVGGTDFDQTPTTATKYWSTTNSATTGASALGYIPEIPWNQSCAGGGAANCALASPNLDIVAGSGGPSSCATQDNNGNCLAGYSAPAWQTGAGVPTNGVRNLPDVSLFASAGFNNSFYIMCEADLGFFGSQQTCSLANYSFVGIGGTSASAPAFAGIMALVNQKTASQGQSGRQGNANYALYKMAAQSGASCNSSTAAATGNSCIFYDITKGNNSVPCISGSPNCALDTSTNYGILVDPNNTKNPAWNASAGYDLASGLGSVNAANLVKAWSSATFGATTTTLNSLTPLSLAHGQPVTVSATVAAKSGTGTPTGSVALMAAPGGNTQGIDSFSLVNGIAGGTTALLPGGSYNVTAHYAGDATFGASDSAPLQVTVGKEDSATKVTVEAENAATNWQFAPTTTIPYGSLLLLRTDISGASGALCDPNPAQSGAACPTGSVKLTASGNTLDAGTYALNSLGYAEDQAVALDLTTLGAYTIGAQYAGDGSYNPSAGSVTATVTQAPTSMYAVQPSGTNIVINGDGTYSYIAYSGQQFTVGVAANTASVLQSPTGTLTILENGSVPPATITGFTSNGNFSGSFGKPGLSFAYISAAMNRTFDTPGSYTYTGSYGGDQFYLASQTVVPTTVTVVDTTFNLASPIPAMTISAPGQTGTTALTLNGVDNFLGQITITCALPVTMLEATCANVMANLSSPSTTAQISITTTAPHTLAMQRTPGGPALAAGALAGLLLFALPRRRRLNGITLILLALVPLACIAGLSGCGSNGGGSGGGGGLTDQGTPAGTYTVNVTATAYNITRTGTFTVTVQ